MKKRTQQIPLPVLLVELDTTGVTREDLPIQVVCRLVDRDGDGQLQMVDEYVGRQPAHRASTPEALAVHGLTQDALLTRSLNLSRIRGLVERAACVVSRNPRFTAKKLHALIPECLAARWYEYPARLQGYPGAHFPADERMDVMTGRVESFGYGRLLALNELMDIDAEQYTLVFDEDGPPEVSVHFGRHKILCGFAETLLKCEVGACFRLHGREDYDFITGYCNDGPAFRERAFRLGNTPSNLKLVQEHHLDVYLERIEGLNFYFAVRSKSATSRTAPSS